MILWIAIATSNVSINSPSICDSDACILLTSKFHCVDSNMIMFDFNITLIVTLHSTLNVLSQLMEIFGSNKWKCIFVFRSLSSFRRQSTFVSSILYQILNDYRECLVYLNLLGAHTNTFTVVLNSVRPM